MILMLLAPALLLSQAASPATKPAARPTAAPAARPTAAGPADDATRLQRCIATIATDPVAARAEAGRWRMAGGGAAARDCGGLAFAAEKNWAAAAAEFESAARDAQLAHDDRAATYWAQGGNAWLAAGDATKARTALDSALTAGTLTGLQLGEARLDHARALVAADDLASARTDIDLALTTAGDDPLAWLLSATLARRMGNLPRARGDIAEALKRSPDDASVQLEAGNIAARDGDETRARAAWAEAARLAPDTPTARNAIAALRQFDPPKP
ncbi:tetratricopeptide (TPR) repeat protein [Sphingomonas aerolata]|nr:tetratricopeptide (TPR) repeat protein [Sphingomonas aerolata]